MSDLSDLALILLSKKPDHFGLFHRQKFEDGGLPVCYLINPAHVPVDQQFRLDVAAVMPYNKTMCMGKQPWCTASKVRCWELGRAPRRLLVYHR